MKKYLSMITVILLSMDVGAQSSQQSDQSLINQQLWIDFYPHYYRSEKVEYYGDAGYRTILGERSWNRVYARPSLKYHLNKKWEFHSGLGVFYIFDTNVSNQLQVTPWQGIQLNFNKRARIGFKHQLKIEERWSFQTEDWSKDFEFRLRYKLAGKIKLNDKLYIPFYGEAFLPLAGPIDEIYQNKGRAGVGLGYQASNDWKLVALINWQRSKSGRNEEVTVSDFAYQLKIIKKWKRVIGRKSS